MREIVLDTETTGLSVAEGDRIIEIGCVELVDKKRTGRTFHTYVNPEREVSAGATEVSGLTYEFLKKYKIFREIYQEFLEFIGKDRLVIHNAQFDVGFLNAELTAVGAATIDIKNVVDTLAMAREKYPGSPSSLDALCRRFLIDSTSRTKHGALIDAGLLAEVYVSMSVEILQKDIFGPAEAITSCKSKAARTALYKHREFRPSDAELEAHAALLQKMKDPVWRKYEK